MPAVNLKEQLQEHYAELSEHLDAAPKRIKGYYLDQDPPNGFPEYEVAPHKQIIRRAASTIQFGFEYERKDPFVDLDTGWGTRDIVFSHVGVGLELLLQGIYMKTEPVDFISKIEENNGETPSHKKAKNQVMGSLPDSLTSEQKAQISIVIEIIRKQRNNTLHLGLHGFHQQGLMIAYYEVAAYLIMEFSEEQFDIVDDIDEYRTAIREGPTISGQLPEEPLPLSTIE